MQARYLVRWTKSALSFRECFKFSKPSSHPWSVHMPLKQLPMTVSTLQQPCIATQRSPLHESIAVAGRKRFTRHDSEQNNTSSGKIRLVALGPGSWDDTIQVTLVDVHAHDASYECISYDRSAESAAVEILHDREAVSIPLPLKCALQSLRYKDRPRNLWADVLVGTTQEEKSLRPGTMRRTIENGDRVIAWLEDSNTQTAGAIDIIRTISNQWGVACLNAGIDKTLRQASSAQIGKAIAKLITYPTEDLQPTNHAVWEEIERILCSDYFKSLQTISDVVLAKKVSFRVGDYAFTWETLVRATQGAVHIIPAVLKRNLSTDMMKTYQLINAIEIAERRHRTDDGVELHPMIETARQFSTIDPREYIFSMLPIVRPSKRIQYSETGEQESELVPDYSKSVEEVFKEAAKHIIHERQDLYLWSNERPPCGRHMTKLPSWVPDWSLPSSGGPKRSPYNGFRKWTDTIQPPKRLKVDDESGLHVQAYAFDRILSMSRTFTEENYRRLCLEEWMPFTELDSPEMEQKADEYWRTLVLNLAKANIGEFRSPSIPSPEMLTSFLSLVSEESLMDAIGHTVHEPPSVEVFKEKLRDRDDLKALLAQAGKGEEYDTLLRTNAIGRRMFITEKGVLGMTAIEEKKDVDAEEDELYGNPLTYRVLASMEKDMKEENSRIAEIAKRIVHGDAPAQSRARPYDIVVAVVGGFQPSILRPLDMAKFADAELEPGLRKLETGGAYRYMGECYLHGMMDGEAMRSEVTPGEATWRTDIELTDIMIT